MLGLSRVGVFAFGGVCIGIVGLACGGGNSSTSSQSSDAGDDVAAVVGGGDDDGGTDGSKSNSDGSTPTDDDGGDSSTSNIDAGRDSAATGTCDLARDPGDSPLCITSTYGVFVDGTNGSDAAGDGSMGNPYASIGMALASFGTKPRIYVCAGTYAENLSFDAAHVVSVYGNFACGTWTVAAGNTVSVYPASGFALRMNGVASAMTIADIAFTAAPGASPASPNSIAAFLSSTSSVTFERDSFTAQAGYAQNPASPFTSNFGTVTNSTSDSAPTANTCGNATKTQGGRGGASTQTPTGGTPGGVAGGQSEACFSGMNLLGGGRDGAGGVAAAADPGPAHSGLLDATAGFLVANGNTGAAGSVGGSGGGGGDGPTSNGQGSGGSDGGCGGAGGPGGLGGGASIGIVAMSSPVAFVSITIVTGAGGVGGSGADAETGQVGGFSPGTPVGNACFGGSGGIGAGGNGGGGGAGGASIGLVFQGTAPTLDGTAAATSATQTGVTIGGAGTPGGAGKAGPAASGGGNTGVAGHAGATGLTASQNAVQDATQL